MTTMRDLLTRAIRKTRARQLGETPDAHEMTAALEDAEAFFRTLTNRQLTDVIITADYTAGEDERITYTAGSYTVTRPSEITSQNRPPRNGAIVEVTGATPTRHVYVSELKSWQPVSGLALGTEFPFGPSVEDAMSDMLAARFCDSIFQQDPSAVLVQLASAGRDAFVARFSPPIAAQVDPAFRHTSDWLQIDESV